MSIDGEYANGCLKNGAFELWYGFIFDCLNVLTRKNSMQSHAVLKF